MSIIQYNHRTMESAVVNLWNECCTFDPLTVQKFRKQALFDENFDNGLCFTAVEDHQVVGFILGTKRKFPYLERGLEPDQGWINVIFVKDEYRRKGIGTKLLKTVEDVLIERGVKRITLAAYSPNYFFAGLDPEQAMDVLYELSSDTRQIGIISHVGKLSESISQKIYVKRTSKGSFVQILK